MFGSGIDLNQHSGILTVAPNATGICDMVHSNQPFDNVTLLVMPVDENSPYTIDVYFYGRLMESHSFPTPSGEYNCFMTYPDVAFPANVGTATIPQHYFPSRKDFIGVPIGIHIYNTSSIEKSFYLYAMFKTYGFLHAEIKTKF